MVPSTPCASARLSDRRLRRRAPRGGEERSLWKTRAASRQTTNVPSVVADAVAAPKSAKSVMLTSNIRRRPDATGDAA